MRMMLLHWSLRACLATVLLCGALAHASEYYGQVTFGGLPAPGATVTATQGDKHFTVLSDERGFYRFADLPDGAWKLEISLPGFTAIHAEVTTSAQTAPGKFELAMLPLDELKKMSTEVHAATAPKPALEAAGPKKPDAATPNAPAEIPKPLGDQNQQSNDGFLVNGSVNNAATSQYSLDRAFGNRRPNSKSLYNGGVAVILDNSVLDAKQYSLSGYDTPKPDYDHITVGFTIGGPLKIPHLLPHGPNMFFAYQGVRSHTAVTDSALVLTEDERAGNLLNAVGQPATIIDPSTGQPFLNNQVPVSTQAAALLKLYPLPNVSGNPLYNFQIPVLNSSHSDVVQLKLDKGFGHRDQIYGNFNFSSSRAGNENLFSFVDTTDTLGLNTTINWSHRFNHGLFLNTTYRFSRERTLIRPEFANQQNIEAEAGIGGVSTAASDWGPPALNFTSGIAALSDSQSAFNRSRTDGFSASVGYYHGRHNISAGADLRKQQYNEFFQQDPRGAFNFFTGTANGSATGSDLADFLIGIPGASSIAYGNADKYLRQTVYDAYATDDWRLLPSLTINAGARWEYGAPMTELFGRLVNLDITQGFAAAEPVLASDPIGPLTGEHYPASLLRPDRLGIEPRVALSWRPIPASTIVIRSGYGVYHDTSVYLTPVLQLAQQSPLSKTLSVQNSPDCPLTLANGFPDCNTTTPNTFAMDPNFRIGYAQVWQLAVQRDLPGAMQGVITYMGTKGTHGVQEFLPNSYPLGVGNPCQGCPSGFAYETSGGDSTRQSLQGQLRRRLRAGFMASVLYTYSKSIDDDSMLGGQGHTSSASSSDSSSASTAASALQTTPSVAQNWLDLKAERSLSAFDQRHLVNLQMQYTSGQGLEGGTLLGGWPGRILKEWTILTQITAGSGLPQSPVYPAVIPGTGSSGSIRPSLTGAPIYASGGNVHLNAAAYTAPAAGAWGTAGRNSITGPDQFSLDSAMQRTFRTGRYFLDVRLDATNLLNHVVFTSWNATYGNVQFGVPVSTNPMRSVQTTIRLRF
jgi:trimeric autotransporter adhesin